MTRSSWHNYWRLMTVFSIIACVLFAAAAAGNGHPPGSAALSGAPQDLQLAYLMLAQASATLLAVFWGTAAIAFGLAWWACALAFAEVKEVHRRLLSLEPPD
jgi:hypothetical protein